MILPASQRVERARSAATQACVYQLGKGGFTPLKDAPWNLDRECDCSGFAAWCMGVSRQTQHPWYVRQNGGWLETTAIVRDATTVGSGLFALVPWDDMQPGDLLVYGDRDGHQGHVGVVSAPGKVIHCSSSNFKHFGDAIRETGINGFELAGAIVARPVG